MDAHTIGNYFRRNLPPDTSDSTIAECRCRCCVHYMPHEYAPCEQKLKKTCDGVSQFRPKKQGVVGLGIRMVDVLAQAEKGF